MTKKVSPIPKGYRTATPCLVVADVTAAIDFYSNAFAATTLSLTNDPTNTLPVHATIKIGNSIVVLQRKQPKREFSHWAASAARYTSMLKI